MTDGTVYPVALLSSWRSENIFEACGEIDATDDQVSAIIQAEKSQENVDDFVFTSITNRAQWGKTQNAH